MVVYLDLIVLCFNVIDVKEKWEKSRILHYGGRINKFKWSIDRLVGKNPISDYKIIKKWKNYGRFCV